MDRIEEEDYNRRIKEGFKAKHSHKMVSEEQLWQLEELFCSQANIPRLYKSRRDCYNSLHKLRTEYATSYKDWEYQEINETDYKMSKKD